MKKYKKATIQSVNNVCVHPAKKTKNKKFKDHKRDKNPIILEKQNTIVSSRAKNKTKKYMENSLQRP